MLPMSTHTLSNIQSFAPRVLTRLRSMADLPQYGTVAGQSVASVLWEEMGHPCRGPINDVDVFVNMLLPRDQRGREGGFSSFVYDPNAQTRAIHTSPHVSDAGSGQEEYSHIKFIALRASINILRTYQAGLVNYTLIDSPLIQNKSAGHSDEVSQSLVEGFDLNMVGVGINLETGALVASDAFIDFLNTCELRVATCNTPAHTLIRLAQKSSNGEVSGVSCDFETEKSLLEVAMLCQQYERASFEHTLPTVVDFGSGKYKALYDGVAHLLPPLVQKISPQYQGSYIHYTLDPPSPQSPGALALMHRATQSEEARLPRCVEHMMVVSKFPQIFELFEPKRSRLPEDEIARRRAHLDMISSSNSDAQNIHCLQAALGKPLPDVVPENMTPADAALFFFNQDCTRSPSLIAKSVQAWESLPSLEQHLALRLGYRADQIVSFAADRKQTWKSLLQKSGLSVLSKSSYFNNLHATEEDSARFLKEALCWIDEILDERKGDVSGVFPGGIDFGRDFAHVLSILPKDQKVQATDKLMRWMLPSWPSVSGQSEDTCKRIANSLAQARIEIPSEFWESMHYGWTAECCREALRGLMPRTPVVEKTFKTRQIISSAFSHISNAQLLENKASLICMLLHLDEKEMVAEEIKRRAGVDILQGLDVISEAIEEDAQKSYSPFAGPLLGEDWLKIEDVRAVVSDLKRAAIEVSTHEAPRQARRVARL